MVPNWAIDEALLTPYEMAVLIVIGRYMPNAFPSAEVIAQKASISRDTVFKSLRSLIKKGLLAKTNRVGTSNQYTYTPLFYEGREGSPPSATQTPPVRNTDGGSLPHGHPPYVIQTPPYVIQTGVVCQTVLPPVRNTDANQIYLNQIKEEESTHVRAPDSLASWSDASESVVEPHLITRGKKKTRKVGNSDLELKTMIGSICEIYRASTGIPLAIGGKEAGILKRLKASHGIDQTIALFRVFLTLEDPFFAKQGYSIGCFSSQIQRCLMEAGRVAKTTQTQTPSRDRWT